MAATNATQNTMYIQYVVRIAYAFHLYDSIDTAVLFAHSLLLSCHIIGNSLIP